MLIQCSVVVLFAAAIISPLITTLGTSPDLEEPTYASENPLYLRIVFGDDETKTMWGVLDENEGTGKGYSCVYLDTDMDSDLTNNEPIRFSAPDKRNRDNRKYEVKFDFAGPLGDSKATYTLDLYSVGSRRYNGKSLDSGHFHWSATVGQWRYFFINGRTSL